MSDVPEEYQQLLKTLTEMKVVPKASNPQELSTWMETFLQQQGKATEIKTEPVPTIQASSSGHYNPPPRISTFHGNDKITKGENTTYDLWRHEVRCLLNEKTHSLETITQAVRRSVKGEAGRVIMRL